MRVVRCERCDSGSFGSLGVWESGSGRDFLNEFRLWSLVMQLQPYDFVFRVSCLVLRVSCFVLMLIPACT